MPASTTNFGYFEPFFEPDNPTSSRGRVLDENRLDDWIRQLLLDVNAVRVSDVR